MADLNLSVAVKRDWLPAHPWAWLSAGFFLVAWSWAWTAYHRPFASDWRILVLALGLLIAGVGAWLRHRDSETVYLQPWLPALALILRLLMAALFAIAALGVTATLILSFMSRPQVILHPGPACLAWLTVFPLASGAALRCLKRKDGQSLLDASEERGLAFCAVAGCCYLGSLTLLYDPTDITNWDSMRLVLRVFTAVSLYGAALVLVGPALCRLMLSVLFVIHFAGISSACLSAPPSPAIVQQTWMRLFRPYLEFMYLNNAYHFYAPDPGPSSYLWFRIIFESEDGTDFGIWHKLPNVDAHGRNTHPVPLEYQRYVAMVEQTAQPETPPPDLIYDANVQTMVPNPMYMNRLMLVPGGQVFVGVKESGHPRIPLHPQILKMQQIFIPADGPRRLLSSFARHVAHEFPTYTDETGKVGKFKSVKIYRVVHAIPPISWFQPQKHGDGVGQPDFFLSPTDPTLYRPFYVGNYNAAGQRLNDHDPFLFWMLPILRERPNDPKSRINDYCRKHAGDPKWQREIGDPD